jgi:hypothetical protein
MPWKVLLRRKSAVEFTGLARGGEAARHSVLTVRVLFVLWPQALFVLWPQALSMLWPQAL